ncbi:ATP-binding cassette domain-containing protein [Sandarakinorhabdus rubra]|uniref:ATP-binding cassette domain-containing protein n=1 Tax=Sandarakinorhabdus rubra TaxID=2672568 RepID=UPI0013DB061B|nr:ATP-binding cassette domain-containing protein [Sandarakinorhabdus rubra]
MTSLQPFAPAALAMAGVRLALGGVPVLDGIDLVIPPGALVALVGASGAGKTSLLRLVNRLVAPDAGHIHLFGADIAAADVMQLRRGIGYAVQGGGLFPHWTVADNIAAVPWLLGWPKPRRLARAAELMAMLDLPERLALRFPGELSGGQASRVGLARALAASPRLLLLDEPFGALDPETRTALADRLEALHRAQGLTTLLVTHDVADALLRADLMLVLDGGRVVAAGPPGAVAADPHPAVQALIAEPLAQARALAGIVAP